VRFTRRALRRASAPLQDARTQLGPTGTAVKRGVFMFPGTLGADFSIGNEKERDGK